MRKQGQLLQRLQPNQDLRIIKTQPSSPSGHPVASNSPTSNKPTGIGPVPAGAGQELLWDHDGAISTDSCLAAMQSGFTIVLRDMPKRCAAAGALVDALEAQLGLPAGANLYLTPAGISCVWLDLRLGRNWGCLTWLSAGFASACSMFVLTPGQKLYAVCSLCSACSWSVSEGSIRMSPECKPPATTTRRTDSCTCMCAHSDLWNGRGAGAELDSEWAVSVLQCCATEPWIVLLGVMRRSSGPAGAL